MEVRAVTEREIFESHYLPRYKTCLELAREILEDAPFANASEVLSCTATLFICWNQHEGYIKSLAEQKQKVMDSQPIRRE